MTKKPSIKKEASKKEATKVKPAVATKTNWQNLRPSAQRLILVLICGLMFMLGTSLVQRFKNPQIVTRLDIPERPQGEMRGNMPPEGMKMPPEGMGSANASGGAGGGMGGMMGAMMGGGGGDGGQIGQLMQAVAKNPNDAKTIMTLAEYLTQTNNFAAAETFAQRALTLDANNADALHLLGVISHNLDKNKEAAEFLERALALREDSNIRYSLGVLYSHFLQDAKVSKEHFQKALEDQNIDPELKKRIEEELTHQH